MEVRCFDLVITRTADRWIVVDNIRYRLSAPQNASCCWAAFSYCLVVTSDAVRLSTDLQYVHELSHSTKMLLSSNCRCWPIGVLIISNRLLITSIFFFAYNYHSVNRELHFYLIQPENLYLISYMEKYFVCWPIIFILWYTRAGNAILGLWHETAKMIDSMINDQFV